MLKITYAAEDAALAQRIIAALPEPVTDANDAPNFALGDVLIAVLRAAPAVTRAVIAAHDRGIHVVGVNTGAALPTDFTRLVDHLPRVDFTPAEDMNALRALVAEAQSGALGAPMRVLTPSKRRSNWRASIVLFVAAAVMFGAGVYLVGVLGIQAPLDEYEALNRDVTLTVDALVRPELESYATLLPRDAAQAAAYPATLEQVPTRIQPFAAATATAVATSGEYIPYMTWTPSPAPTNTPDLGGGE